MAEKTEGLGKPPEGASGLECRMRSAMKKYLTILLSTVMLVVPMMFTVSVYAQEKGAGGTESKAAETVKPEKKAVKKSVKHHKKHVKKAHKAKAAKEPAKATETAPAGK